MKVSIVVPFYNEEENIAPMAAELAALAQELPDLEILLVDDGSTDHTADRIEEAARRYPMVRGVLCPRNQGQSSATLHGLHQATGDVLVTLDGDLQNNPADIPRLVRELGAHDAVCGFRAKRKDTWSKRIASRIGNGVRNFVTHDGLRDTGCALKVFKRHCLHDLLWVNCMHRFIGAYLKLNGRDIVESPVDHRPRISGTSKYNNWNRTVRGIYDLMGFVWYRKRHVKRMKIRAA